MWTNIWARKIISGDRKFSEVPDSRKEAVKAKIQELLPNDWKEFIPE